MRDTSTSTATELDEAAWIRRSAIQEAGCVTLVRETGLDRVAAGFGAVGDRGRSFDFEEFCEESFACADSYPMIALRPVGGWTLVVEDAGHQGSRPEVLRRVTSATRAVSAFWDAAGRSVFTHATASVVRTVFEPTLPEVREGCAPDELEELRGDLPWTTDPVVSMLALAGRMTGVSPAESWLHGQWRTFPVAEWPDDWEAGADSAQDVAGLPAELSAVLRGCDAAAHRRAAIGVAEHALERTGALSDPELRHAVAALRAGTADPNQLAGLVRQWNWHGLRHRAASPERERRRAVWTMWRAADVDPLSAVVRTVAEARHVRGLATAGLVELVGRVVRADTDESS